MPTPTITAPTLRQKMCVCVVMHELDKRMQPKGGSTLNANTNTSSDDKSCPQWLSPRWYNHTKTNQQLHVLAKIAVPKNFVQRPYATICIHKLLFVPPTYSSRCLLIRSGFSRMYQCVFPSSTSIVLTWSLEASTAFLFWSSLSVASPLKMI